MNDQLQKRLEAVAWKQSSPFCYGCYRKAPTGRCTTCFSDDLMRITENNGPEYGIEWVVEDIVKENLEAVDIDETFEESMSGCYPETTKIGWIDYDTVSAIKELDPISWDLAKSEWVDSEAQDEILFTLDNGSTYFRTSDLEDWLDVVEAGREVA